MGKETATLRRNPASEKEEEVRNYFKKRCCVARARHPPVQENKKTTDEKKKEEAGGIKKGRSVAPHSQVSLTAEVTEGRAKMKGMSMPPLPTHPPLLNASVKNTSPVREKKPRDPRKERPRPLRARTRMIVGVREREKREMSEETMQSLEEWMNELLAEAPPLTKEEMRKLENIDTDELLDLSQPLSRSILSREATPTLRSFTPEPEVWNSSAPPQPTLALQNTPSPRPKLKTPSSPPREKTASPVPEHKIPSPSPKKRPTGNSPTPPMQNTLSPRPKLKIPSPPPREKTASPVPEQKTPSPSPKKRPTGQRPRRPSKKNEFRMPEWMPPSLRGLFRPPPPEDKQIVRKWFCHCEGRGLRSVIAILGVNENGPCYQKHDGVDCDFSINGGTHTCVQKLPGLIWCNCTLSIEEPVACVAKEDCEAAAAEPISDELSDELLELLDLYNYEDDEDFKSLRAPPSPLPSSASLCSPLPSPSSAAPARSMSGLDIVMNAYVSDSSDSDDD